MSTSPVSSPIAPQKLIHPDFQVLDTLCASDFGWMYLVRDLRAPGEPKVLEELLLSPATPLDLAMVVADFRLALAPLKALRHPQLARPEDVLWLGDRLFWLREYIPGVSYRVLLQQRLAAGGVLSEATVRSLLLDVLPVLVHMHQEGIFHHQLDLDNIICNEHGQMPVLTRYGELRDVGIELGLYRLKPPESWSGEVALEGVDRDLHDLAYVALLLLTGEHSATSISARLESAVGNSHLSVELAAILEGMLIPKPWQRDRTAEQIYNALLENQPLENSSLASPAVPTAAIDPPRRRRVSRRPPPRRDPVLAGLSIVFMGLLTLALWRVARAISPKPTAVAARSEAAIATPKLASVPPTAPIQIVPINVDPQWRDQLQKENPNLMPVIETQLKSLSPEARRDIGKYYRRDYDRWFTSIADLKISQLSVDSLADTLFYLRFPSLQGKTLNPRTWGQLWYAIARDQITDLSQKKSLEILKTGTFNQSGQLHQGQSRIYHVQVPPGQNLRLKLEGDRANLRLSVIAREIALLKYSNQREWIAPRSAQDKTYEMIITPMQLDAVSYQLQLDGGK
jgi:serine/threonine protein kinase, bacterial